MRPFWVFWDFKIRGSRFLTRPFGPTFSSQRESINCEMNFRLRLRVMEERRRCVTIERNEVLSNLVRLKFFGKSVQTAVRSRAKMNPRRVAARAAIFMWGGNVRVVGAEERGMMWLIIRPAIMLPKTRRDRGKIIFLFSFA